MRNIKTIYLWGRGLLVHFRLAATSKSTGSHSILVMCYYQSKSRGHNALLGLFYLDTCIMPIFLSSRKSKG